MRLEEPIKQILIDTRPLWDHSGTRPAVREGFRRMIDCRTPALGWQIYASDTEEKRVYHTCKSKPCPSCGYRATLLWQRDQWTQLPDVAYTGVVFTMPNVLWPIFKENRHLLHDLPSIGAAVISQWMKEKYGVRPLILAVQHTFGRHLNFNPHLHMLVSAGGLSEAKSQWIGRLSLNPVAFVRMWTYGVITYLRRAIKAEILKADLSSWELKKLLTAQYERGWHIDISRKISKAHFLGYAARYIRRPPIAQHRFQEIDGPTVKFWTKDTKTKETVLDELPKKEFIEMLAEHVADRYQHGVRYYGLLSPRSRGRAFATLFALLGKARRPRLPRLPWADSIMRYFGRNPLIDSRGQPMQYIGRYCPTAT
jgi:hypothetical protein